MRPPRNVYVYEDFQAFLMAFKAVSERLQTADDFGLIAYEMIRSLAAQGVVHAEVYLSWGILHRFKPHLPIPAVMEAIEAARVQGERESLGRPSSGSSTRCGTSAWRRLPRFFGLAAELRKTYPSIVGIGIGGDEARGPAEPFRALFAEAKAAGLHLTAHAGESTGPVMGPASIWSALNIGAERIGHALAAQHDEDLLRVLAERQIPLEINLTSNLRTGCCASLAEHPVREYFEGGLFLTLNSDDPPMFGSDLLEEYILVQREYEFTLEQMREFAANSIEASFLPPERKLKLLAAVEQYR